MSLIEEIDNNPRVIIYTDNLRMVGYRVLDNDGRIVNHKFDILQAPHKKSLNLSQWERNIAQSLAFGGTVDLRLGNYRVEEIVS